MPVRYLKDGTVVVDTVSEAVEYERSKSKPARAYNSPNKIKPAPLDAGLTGTWEGFCLLVSGSKNITVRKVLALVKGRDGAGISHEELAKGIGIPRASLNGTLGALSRAAVKAGLDAPVVIRGTDKRLRAGALLQARDPPTP